MTVIQHVGLDGRWSHPSVVRLMGASDNPIAEIVNRARRLVLEAMSDGWTGPPYDPMSLAALRGIATVARADVEDARIVPQSVEGVLIEFNPNRPQARIRYSVAHEIAHTLFDDCREQVRNRSKKTETEGEDWQLEMLCNIAAAEILMPLGSLPDLDASPLTIDRVGELRRKYEVSTEAILLRAVKLSRQAICSFAASRVEHGPDDGRYRIDYTVPSQGWVPRLRPGILLPPDTLLDGCTAIGFTVKGNEEWPGGVGRIHIEAAGVQPYQDRLYPRVLGFLRPLHRRQAPQASINCVIGDATQPRGTGFRLLVHIVNDKTPNWGAGFAAAVKNKWPLAQEDFQHWAHSGQNRLKLGNVHFSKLETNLAICHMVSQRGYGQSSKPRIRYDALADCLESAGDYALSHNATVHMPRIGTGQAGGSWNIVEELIKEVLCRRDIEVNVYDLRNAKLKIQPAQQQLFDLR